MKPPKFSTAAPGERDPNEGTSLVEAEALVDMLRAVGKVNSGVASVLWMAMAVLLVDTRRPEDIEGVIEHTPGLLRQMVRQVLLEREEGAEH